MKKLMYTHGVTLILFERWKTTVLLGTRKFMDFSNLEQDCVEHFRVKITVENEVDEYSISTNIVDYSKNKNKSFFCILKKLIVLSKEFLS